MRALKEREKRWIERTIVNDRSYKAFLYNRFFTFALLVFLQLVAFAALSYLFVYHSRIAILLQAVLSVLEILFAIYIVNTHEGAATRLHWVILVLLVPVFGVPMYLFNGRGRPTRRMNARIQEQKTHNKRYADKNAIPSERLKGLPVCYYLANSQDYPAYGDGEAEYYSSGEACFPDMLNAVRSAREYILVEYFIIAHGKMWNELLKLLVEKAMQGVRVRIIYDDFGCMVTLPPKYERYLEGLHENIQCLNFNAVVPFLAMRMNNRDHRKMLVVDGKTAFTGGINIADEYINEKRRFGYWKDSAVRVTGSSVRSFILAFFYLWNACRKNKEDIASYLSSVEKGKTLDGGYIQPYDDSPLDSVSVGETVYTDLLNTATEYAYIFTPYLVIDESMRSALCRAALRGVDVRIVTPGIPDKKAVYRLTRANYKLLMRAGVKIYEYEPGFLHAKSIVSDNRAVVGTINFDYRSLYHHFENAVYFTDCKAVEQLKRDCEETFAVSCLRTKTDMKRGIIGVFVDWVLRIFETMF